MKKYSKIFRRPICSISFFHPSSQKYGAISLLNNKNCLVYYGTYTLQIKILLLEVLKVFIRVKKTTYKYFHTKFAKCFKFLGTFLLQNNKKCLFFSFLPAPGSKYLQKTLLRAQNWRQKITHKEPKDRKCNEYHRQNDRENNNTKFVSQHTTSN